MATDVATCQLTKRCRVDSLCRHHEEGCEHIEQWEADRVEDAKMLEAIAHEIEATKQMIGLLRGLSWEGRERVLRMLWDRFYTHPRCADDPDDER